jgi:hypothetical protein
MQIRHRKGIQTELECNHVERVGPMQSKRKPVASEEGRNGGKDTVKL